MINELHIEFLDVFHELERKGILNLKCIHGLLNNRIDSPPLLSQINVEVSSHTPRFQKTFHIPSPSSNTNYSRNELTRS